MNRRSFLRAAAVLSTATGVARRTDAGTVRVERPGAAPQRPGASPGAFSEREQARHAALRALEAAKRLGASYAEVQIVRLRQQRLLVDNDHLADLSDEESYGAEVRAFAGGAGGLCATPHVSESELEQAAGRAVQLAQLGARAGAKEAPPPPRKAVQMRWVAPFQLDPFALPLEQKIEALLSAARAALSVKAQGVKLQAFASLRLVREDRTLYTMDGSIIEQLIVRTAPRLLCLATDRGRGLSLSRWSDGDFPARAIGWEYLQRDRFTELAPRLAEDALRALRAKEVSAGTYDLILHPSHLDAIIQGTIAQATALGPVLGAGTGGTFLTLPNLGRLQLASPIVSFIADRTQPEGLATCAFEDDGGATGRYYLVQKGKLISYQGGRAPPNVSLEAGAAPLSLVDLLADSKRAIYIEGRGEIAVDPHRRRFQVEGGCAWLIEDGKKKTPLRRVRYEAGTLAFFRACDRLCGAAEYRLGGGLPADIGLGPGGLGTSHGCAPARFRGIAVGGAG